METTLNIQKIFKISLKIIQLAHQFFHLLQMLRVEVWNCLGSSQFFQGAAYSINLTNFFAIHWSYDRSFMSDLGDKTFTFQDRKSLTDGGHAKIEFLGQFFQKKAGSGAKFSPNNSFS